MLEYLLKSGACMAIFLLFYKAFLERENMHVFKRFFLLAALIAALIIPNIVFTSYIEIVSNNNFSPSTKPYVAIMTNEPQDVDMINWPLILWTVYVVGVLFFSFRFVRHLSQILTRIKRNPNFRQKSSIKVLLKETLPPHTFFSYIFLNRKKFEEKSIPQEVLLHEETHAKQRHSLDVLFIELVHVILWFNPLVYLFKKSIKLNHEFLADNAVLKEDTHTANYQNTLLSYLSKESLEKYQSTGIANAINYSSIKKRFTVMKKRTSKKSIVLRSFLLLPLIALLLLGFSERKLVEREKTNPIVNEIALLIDNIEIRIDSEGKLFFKDNEQVTLESLKNHLLSLNSNLSKQEREQQVRAIINVESDTPKEIIKEVDRMLTDYGVAQINILGPEPVYVGKLIENITEQSQIKKYNMLAKKYNAIPIENRKIPLKDLKFLEGIYKQMTKIQRKEAQPFPECLPKSIQEGASRKQMAEYNSLAKKYNEMDGNRMRILKSDVERLEYIYALMSDKQKADAEPFPDFPEPPPAPDAPKAPNEGEEASNTIQKIIDEQDPYDQVTISIDRTSKPPKHTAVYIGSENDKNKIEKQMSKSVNTPKSPRSPRVLKGQASTIPPPPAAKTAPKVLKGEESSIPTPPLPPEPIAPLDYAIAMAKKGAKFYYEGKEVSSDKAIELLKKNKSLNIDSRSAKGTRVVRLSKEPITIK